ILARRRAGASMRRSGTGKGAPGAGGMTQSARGPVLPVASLAFCRRRDFDPVQTFALDELRHHAVRLGIFDKSSHEGQSLVVTFGYEGSPGCRGKRIGQDM